MMKLLKAILVIALLYWAMDATAQTSRVNPPDRSNINHYDPKGKPDGMWVLNEGARMGEPSNMQFGKYDHGEKYGPWYKLDEEGDLVSMETFHHNVLDGEAKYFDRGKLIATGTYRGLNPEREYDTVIVEDPVTGAQSLRSVHNDRNTVRHGTWRFYNADNGRLVREEEYQIDSLIFSKEFPMSKADSAFYQKREANMPHHKKKYYTPPGDVGVLKY